MIVAGVMSGTSADGINVAFVKIREPRSKRRRRASFSEGPAFSLLGHEEYPYPERVRDAILQMMNAPDASVAYLARLNFLLGELYAEAIRKAARQNRVMPELVGCHGQTLYHQGTAAAFLGRKLAATWQTGEGAIVAARVGAPVVSDFRPADMAQGGKGAPLVPFLDYFLYRSSQAGRIAQNIGGISNLTAIPIGATPRQLIAFDTGPGNMVIDAAMQKLYGRPFDRDGRVAASGRPQQAALHQLLHDPFFRRRPPRTAGREEFGREYLKHFLKVCNSRHSNDIIATATSLTARSIANAILRFILPTHRSYKELIVSGGGAKNPTLLAMLRNEISAFGIDLRVSDEFGVPSEAKEAVAFAILAYETWNRRASNVPAATGAKHPAILGKISYA